MKRAFFPIAVLFVILGCIIGALLKEIAHQQAIDSEREIARNSLLQARRDMNDSCQAQLKRLNQWWSEKNQKQVDSVVLMKQELRDSTFSALHKLQFQLGQVNRQKRLLRDTLRLLKKGLWQQRVKKGHHVKATANSRDQPKYVVGSPDIQVGDLKPVEQNLYVHRWQDEIGETSKLLALTFILYLLLLRQLSPRKQRARPWRNLFSKMET